MNQAGMFAPDINFTPSAAVYPGSGGGTSAAAASAMSATTNTVVDPGNGSVGAAAVNAVPPSGKTVWYWLGFVGLLMLLVFVARKAGSEEDFRNLKPTFYNFLAITLTSIVGITGMKVLATKFPVPGASNVILAA